MGSEPYWRQAPSRSCRLPGITSAATPSSEPVAPAAAAARRRRFAVAIPLVLVVGAASRFGLHGALADAAGGIFYTILIYTIVGLIRPTWAPSTLAVIALACSVAVELFQLTSIPADLADAFSPARLVFGSSFAATDLPAYATGALAAFLFDRRSVRS